MTPINDPRPILGLTFPAVHELIAVGPPGEAFCASIEAALLAAGARRSARPLSQKLSRTGKYQSVHIEVHVESREELEALYAVLKAHPDVVYRL
jgi:putative lipoic acid-binding regulatory protein